MKDVDEFCLNFCSSFTGFWDCVWAIIVQGTVANSLTTALIGWVWGWMEIADEVCLFFWIAHYVVRHYLDDCFHGNSPTEIGKAGETSPKDPGSPNVRWWARGVLHNLHDARYLGSTKPFSEGEPGYVGNKYLVLPHNWASTEARTAERQVAHCKRRDWD